MRQRRRIYYAVAAVSLAALAALAAQFSVQMSAQKQQARDIETGSVLYAENCASCHGTSLEGQPNWRSPDDDGIYPAPPHNDEGHTWHHADQLLFDYTKLGGAVALAKGGVENFSSGMPAFAETLSDSEILSTLAYIKSTWSERSRMAQAERSNLEQELSN